MVHYQNCSNGSSPLNKMTTRAKNRKILKQHLLQWPDFKIMWLNVSLMAFYQNCLMVPLHWTRWLLELKIKKSLNSISILLGQWPCFLFQNNFTDMFLICPFIKIAKMVLLIGWTKWLPELIIVKPLKKSPKTKIKIIKIHQVTLIWLSEISSVFLSKIDQLITLSL